MNLALALLLSCAAPAQSMPPPNLDFHTGTLDGWEGSGFHIAPGNARRPTLQFGVTSGDPDKKDNTGVLHLTYVIGAATAGLGGALIAIAAGHIDPELAYWTTSGEFVFVAILSGVGHVAAPLLGMALFELLRSFAFQYSPYTWQMVVGLAMLGVILFLPSGLWSLFARRRRAGGAA